MAIADRIVLFLRERPQGADDGEIAAALGLKRRQQANAECKALVERGLLVREHFGGHVVNRLAPQDATSEVAPPATEAGGRWDRPWSWEGNVIARVVSHYALQGLVAEAETDGKEYGPTVRVSAGDAAETLIAIRGAPPESSHSRLAQARAGFAGAILDLALWRGEDAARPIALALPDHVTYRRLAERSAWLIGVMGAEVLWVHGDGSVVFGGGLGR